MPGSGGAFIDRAQGMTEYLPSHSRILAPSHLTRSNMNERAPPNFRTPLCRRSRRRTLAIFCLSFTLTITSISSSHTRFASFFCRTNLFRFLRASIPFFLTVLYSYSSLLPVFLSHSLFRSRVCPLANPPPVLPNQLCANMCECAAPSPTLFSYMYMFSSPHTHELLEHFYVTDFEKTPKQSSQVTLIPCPV